MKRLFLGIIVIAIIIAIALYVMGYWSAAVEPGQLPSVNVDAQGGKLPTVDVDSNITVGTKETSVEAPGLVENSTIEVPTVGATNETVDANTQ